MNWIPATHKLSTFMDECQHWWKGTVYTVHRLSRANIWLVLSRLSVADASSWRKQRHSTVPFSHQWAIDFGTLDTFCCACRCSACGSMHEHNTSSLYNFTPHLLFPFVPVVKRVAVKVLCSLRAEATSCTSFLSVCWWGRRRTSSRLF